MASMNIIKLGKYLLKNIIRHPVPSHTSYVKDVSDFIKESEKMTLEHYSDGEILDLYVISEPDPNNKETVLLAFQRQQEGLFFLMKSQNNIKETVSDLSAPNVVINFGNLELIKLF